MVEVDVVEVVDVEVALPEVSEVLDCVHHVDSSLPAQLNVLTANGRPVLTGRSHSEDEELLPVLTICRP